MKRVLLFIVLGVVGLFAVAFAAGMVRDATENPAAFFEDAQTLALADALIANDGDTIAALLVEGADLDARGIDGVTLLQWRLLRDDLGRFIWLLELGADPNVQGWHGETAMHLAAQHRGTAYLEALLDRGGDVDAVNRRLARTPLYLAMDAREQKNVDLLLERGADIHFADSTGTQPLLHAARINSFANVVRLLQLGADPEATDALGTTFQPSLFRTDPKLLNHEALRSRNWVIAFLEDHGVPIIPEAREIAESPAP